MTFSSTIQDGTYGHIDRTIENRRWPYEDSELILSYVFVDGKNGRKRVEYALTMFDYCPGAVDIEDGEHVDTLVGIQDLSAFADWFSGIIPKAVNYSEWNNIKDVLYRTPWDDDLVNCYDFCRRAASFYVNMVSPTAERDEEMIAEAKKRYHRSVKPTDEMEKRIKHTAKRRCFDMALNVVAQMEQQHFEPKAIEDAQ